MTITASVNTTRATSNPYTSVNVSWSWSISPAVLVEVEVDTEATIVYYSAGAGASGSGSSTVSGFSPGELVTSTLYVVNTTNSLDNKTVQSSITTALYPTWGSSSFNDGTVGVAYSDTATAWAGSGGLTISSYTLVSGTLPPGLTLSKSGNNALLSGTPNTKGTYTFTLKGTDSFGTSVNKGFTVVIGGPLGEMQTYNGTTWSQGPAYVYNGTTWVQTPVYYYTGSTWTLTKGT